MCPTVKAYPESHLATDRGSLFRGERRTCSRKIVMKEVLRGSLQHIHRHRRALSWESAVDTVFYCYGTDCGRRTAKSGGSQTKAAKPEPPPASWMPMASDQPRHHKDRQQGISLCSVNRGDETQPPKLKVGYDTAEGCKMHEWDIRCPQLQTVYADLSP